MLDKKSSKLYNEYLPLLLYIAYKTKLHKEVVISTNDLGNSLGFSQQTASRKITELEQQGYLNKGVVAEGLKIRLTSKGKEILQENYITLQSLFCENAGEISGCLLSGYGEGRYYVQIEGYQKQFKEKLNMIPYPGTLNLKVDPLQARSFIAGKMQIIIDGFLTKERTFGGIECYPVKINKKVDGFLIRPIRTNHPEGIIEIIAPTYLRGDFNLEDGDSIYLE